MPDPNIVNPMTSTKHFFYLYLIAAFLIAAPAWAQQGPTAQATPATPKNVILFIADGTGPASLTMARDYLRDQEGRDALALDSIQIGSVRTHSSDSRVTDSAASATALAAGVKTYNGAIAVDTLQRPVASVLEAAEERGMATGLVATSRITHATPAAFAAHVPSRNMEDEIARQMVPQGVDVLFGGGRRHFTADSTLGGSRADSLDLLAEARAEGYQVVLDREGFSGELQTPVLGLFTPDHMAYEIDRDSTAEPSLAEMTTKAIDLLNDGENGFFLMVEGSRIDHAGHANDAAAHLHDLLAYNEAVAAALDFARRDGQTLVLAVSDHETGGLSLGRSVDGVGVYAWEPAVLAEIKGSHGAIIGALLAANEPARSDTPSAQADSAATARSENALASVVGDLTGVDDLSEDEAAGLEAALADGALLNALLSEIVSRRAVIGWTTSGHTAVDVPLYAYGPGHERLVGNHENTIVGEVIADVLGLDLDALTEALQAQQSESRTSEGAATGAQ